MGRNIRDNLEGYAGRQNDTLNEDIGGTMHHLSYAIQTGQSACVKPKMLLVDDDPVFCRIMKEAAASEGYELDAFDSLLSLGYLGHLRNYDAIILDYYLEHLSGIEIAEYLDQFVVDIPAIMISCRTIGEEEIAKVPSCIRSFVSKNKGYSAILHAAINAYYEDHYADTLVFNHNQKR